MGEGRHERKTQIPQAVSLTLALIQRPVKSQGNLKQGLEGEVFPWREWWEQGRLEAGRTMSGLLLVFQVRHDFGLSKDAEAA